MNRLNKWIIAAVGTLSLTVLTGKWTPAAVFSPQTGHYYDFVEADLSWQEAKEAAELLSFQGLQGYLVTITSQEEQDFIVANLASPSIDNYHGSWIGASDQTVEGTWQWVTGPEAGTVFWQNSTPIGYHNFLSSEPNNYPHVVAGEDYAIMLANAQWADTTERTPLGRSAGFIIEYGGLESSEPEQQAVPEPSAVTALLLFGALTGVKPCLDRVLRRFS
ncbi:MAG: C-type lectin domain-containing protein [Cyanobacteria bacterium P01_G01_bin.54]